MKTFEELGVSPEIRRAIEEMGYEQPMPVQEEVIPYLLGENNDVVALAQTGTGKTAAFGLPLIQKINVNNRIPQSLILCPTRELCLQIAGDLNDYSKYIDGLRVLPVYGGSSIESQIRALKRVRTRPAGTVQGIQFRIGMQGGRTYMHMYCLYRHKG